MLHDCFCYGFEHIVAYQHFIRHKSHILQRRKLHSSTPGPNFALTAASTAAVHAGTWTH